MIRAYVVCALLLCIRSPLQKIQWLKRHAWALSVQAPWIKWLLDLHRVPHLALAMMKTLRERVEITWQCSSS